MGSLIPDLGFLDFLFSFYFYFIFIFIFIFIFFLGNTNNTTEHIQNAKVKQAFSHRSFYFSLSDSPNEHTTKNTTTPLPGTDSQTKRPHTPPPPSSHPYHTTSLPTYLPSSASVIHILPLFFFLTEPFHSLHSSLMPSLFTINNNVSLISITIAPSAWIASLVVSLFFAFLYLPPLIKSSTRVSRANFFYRIKQFFSLQGPFYSEEEDGEFQKTVLQPIIEEPDAEEREEQREYERRRRIKKRKQEIEDLRPGLLPGRELIGELGWGSERRREKEKRTSSSLLKIRSGSKSEKRSSRDKERDSRERDGSDGDGGHGKDGRLLRQQQTTQVVATVVRVPLGRNRSAERDRDGGGGQRSRGSGGFWGRIFSSGVETAGRRRSQQRLLAAPDGDQE